MAEIKETCVEYTNYEDYATFCSSEKKWINKILRLQSERPNEVKVVLMPEDNGGVLLAKIPKSYLKVSPPRQVNYTDEQKAAMAERLSAAREKKGEDE